MASTSICHEGRKKKNSSSIVLNNSQKNGRGKKKTAIENMRLRAVYTQQVLRSCENANGF